MENLRYDLTCPITQELFEDPVTLPCCGKAVSRAPLVDWLNRNPVCPLCNNDLSTFDATNAAKNVIIAGMIDTLNGNIPVVDISKHRWKCTLTPITENATKYEMMITVEDAKFSTRPSLFIAVLDRSGSMGGKPGQQVSVALRHIEALSKQNEQVKLVMLSYGSECKEIQTASEYQIDGGTNFRAAFKSVEHVLTRYICSDKKEDLHKINNISTVTIAFLTDGEDGSGNRERLVPEFREMLLRKWGHNPISVHAIGFGTYCDQKLLEEMRLAGNIPGMFRYAQQDDNDDALCQKLTGIFEVSSKASSVPVTFTINGVSQEVRLPVDAQYYGEYKNWIDCDQDKKFELMVNSSEDNNVQIPVEFKEQNMFVFQRWVSFLVDQLATKVLELSKKDGLSPNLRDLECAMLAQQVDAISTASTDEHVVNTLEFISQQIDAIKAGKAVNLGKLNDARFNSLFSAPAKMDQVRAVPPEDHLVPKKLDDKPYFEEPLKRYSRNNKDKGRNPLQEAIMKQEYNKENKEMEKMIQTSSYDDLYHKDINGNNALMLAAYCGHAIIVNQILKQFPNMNLELENNNGETAVTLTIKKRGFHFALAHLLDAGAKIPRTKSIERFAINKGFIRTAEIISNYGDGSLEVDETMTSDYVKFTYQRAITSGREFDVQSFLNVALAKQLKDLAQKLIYEHKAVPTLNMLVEHCIPKKPDSPDTQDYIELAEMVLDANPGLIHEKTEKEECALLVACKKGSLPHVQLFIKRGSEIDVPNEKGNTPFWVASYMRYPCIMTELLGHGANVNWTNLKGNNPLYGAVERGPVKIAELLISRGCNIEHFNENGDTLILLACRNGQFEVLNFLLDYVSDDFINHKAHIDGFNAILASSEANRPECIRVLHEHGIDINQITDDDNQILARATPLHIASYYGRTDAVRELIKHGAKVNEKDINGSTPLHIAVIQGFIDIIKLLRNADADLMAKDNSGNTPMSYCRNRADIRKVLVNPALDILMKLAKGGFDKLEEEQACEIIRRSAGAEGCLSSTDAIDIRDYDGSTPLLQAVIHSSRNVVMALLDVKADPRKKNAFGVDSHIWSIIARNPRISKSLVESDKHYIPDMKMMERLDMARKNPSHAEIFFLGQRPDYSSHMSSGIMTRMTEFANAPYYGDVSTVIKNVPRIEDGKSSIVNYFRDKSFEELQHSNLLWNAKIFTLNMVASGCPMDPKMLMAICMYTNNALVPRIVNMSILQNKYESSMVRDYIGLLYRSLESLPNYTGEVFIGSDSVDRKLFLKDREFCWPSFVSGSSLWRVATENTPLFTTKSRQGVVFLIKSKTGKFVGSYSQFSFDAEVMFAPYTRFKVTNWYHGDVFALGQANIREHTFKVHHKDDERMIMADMIESNKSLIIELTEL